MTMRAVDQEAKRLDDAEKEQRRLEAAAEALRRVPDAAAAAGPPQTGSLQPAPSAQARAPDLPTATEIKPIAPPIRRPPPPAAAPAPKPFNLLEFFPGAGR